MLDRTEIKARAEAMFKKQYWVAVVIGLIGPLATGFGNHQSGGAQINTEQLGLIDGSFLWQVICTALVASFVIQAVLNVITVGASGAFAKIYSDERANYGDMFAGFDNFLRNFLGMLWMQVLICLWSLLMLIPGIVKGIAYSMTPYILAESKDLSATEAVKLSERMTDGYKMEIFTMQLSFIGWYLLSIFTFGILAILYVEPYLQTTKAGYYVHLRTIALENGIIHPEELE